MRDTPRLWTVPARYAAIALVVLLALPFVYHAGSFGLRGMFSDISSDTHLDLPGAAVSNAAIFAHMLLGVAIMATAPLQLIGAIRRNRPRLHRATGYVTAAGRG